MAYNLKDEEETKQYIHNLGIEYRFGCYSEKKPEVCHLLGDFLESIKKDFAKACLVYKSNCDDSNYPRSCFKFGTYSVLGRGMKEPNIEQAYKYFKKSCDLGESDACLNAGLMNINRGPHSRPVQDRLAGLAQLDKCCEANRGFCCFFLSGVYIGGMKEADIPKDMEKAYKYAVKGCELGEMYACANLSEMYRRGEGIEKNEELAEKYKKKAKQIQNDYIKMKPTLEFQQGSKKV